MSPQNEHQPVTPHTPNHQIDAGCPTHDGSLIVGMRGLPENARVPAKLADPLDQVLSAIARTEPPAGLEQRVLRNVEARWAVRQAASRAARWRTAFSQVSRPSFIACASVAALLLIIAAVSYRHHEEAPAVAQTRPSILSSRQPPESMPAVASVHTPARPAAARPLPLSATHRNASTASPAIARPKPSQEPGDNFDYPAPEPPLTPQERLLLRIAYGDRPLQMATNKRLILPIRPADDATDFDKFFEPYTLPLTEGDPK